MAATTIVSGFIGQVHNVVNFDNGMSLLKFSVADNDTYINKNKERVENTQWYNVEVRGKQGSFDNILSKGVIAQRNYVTVKGKMRFKPVGEGQKGHYHSLDVAHFGDVEVGYISDKAPNGQSQGGQGQQQGGQQQGGQQQGNFGGQQQGGQQQGNFGGQQQGGQQQGNFGGQQQGNFGGQQQGNFGGQQQGNFGGQQQGNFGGQQAAGGMGEFDDEIPF